jgi:hypothetical protein
VNHLWTCKCCGKQFNSLPMSFAPLAPDPWLAIPEAERAKRGKIDSDLCVIDQEWFFVRGCVEIPVHGHRDAFVWGVWVSVSKTSFERILELWNVKTRKQDHPFFGWLCNEISIYPKTFGLKTHVHLRNNGVRPLIELEPTDHPLAVEQSEGISLHRVEEIASRLLAHH